MSMEERSINDTAFAALFNALVQPRAQRREYLGALLPDGTYTEPQTQAGASSRSQARVPANLIGLYHNHPPGRGNQDFSPHDLEVAERLGVPSYIAIQERGQHPLRADFRKYDPANPSPTRTVANGDRISRGDDFLARFPMDEFRAYLMKKLLDRAPDDERGLMR